MLLTGVRTAGVDGETTLRVDGDRFATGPGDAAEPRLDLAGCVLLPGGVDLHVHGGGGHDVATSAADLAGAVAFHHAHGTAATLASLVTAPVAALCEQLDRVADACERGVPAGVVVGAHLEGPFLSRVRCGAQNPEHLLAPDRGAFAELLAAARGHLRMITVAPELPGALDLIADALAADVLVAVGHTDASYEQTLAAFDAGAQLATHLFNGMRPVHHRDPGPVVAALERGVVCELINDGVHLHAAAARLARDRARPVLITDAIDAAGAPDGRYALGGQEVAVADGEARLASSDSLAGSTLTLDAAAGRALRDGWTVDEVTAAVSTLPAQLLGVDDRFGVVAPGRRADALVLDAGGRLRGTLDAGAWRSAR